MTLLSISARLDYRLGGPGDAILAIEAAACRDQRIRKAHIEVPGALHFARVPADEGVGQRILVRIDGQLSCTYTAEVEVDRSLPDLSTLAAVPVHQLTGPAVRYLMASRFCPSDRFQSFVASEFAGLTGGRAVAAMSEWVNDSMTYVSGTSGPHTTALESFVQRQGVCRDYAHLMITFARAAGIPARMASVYAPDVAPPDFHAVAEVFLEGGWVPVDATGMASPDEMALICVGRDAADIAFLTVYGAASMATQEVDVAIAA